MTGDPIVAEVRAVREELAEAYGYDIAAILVALRAAEATTPGHLVILSPKRLAPVPESRIDTGG